MILRPDRPRGRSRAGRLLALAAVPVLPVPLVIAVPGHAADADPEPTVVVSPHADAAETSADSITLVTGDQVIVDRSVPDRSAVVVEPAPRTSGEEPDFEVLEDDGDLYVIPSDAAVLIPDRVDAELFNVTKLIDYGYDDGVPVLVTDAPRRTLAAQDGVTDVLSLPSIDGFAARVEPDGQWWSTMLPAAGHATAQASGTTKVWLDELLKVSLDESVPMIGAPQAWSQGFDGTGQTVAVLDTGIDPDHPDLVGQVADTRNFTADADVIDRHGHGTHVAGTIAGTGAGSDGRLTGVAPGADLLIGKICDSTGTCPTSGTIAAMQWAAPLADVINMSIGTNIGDDGNSVTAQAINELSEDYPDTLFVVAAGNNGSRGQGSIASPGSADAALTVGAVDKNGNLASFSSRGPRLGDFAIKPDVTAPGVGIVAPRAAGTAMGTPVDDLYTAANGTSMATPHVAGAAAIAMQHDPDLTAQQIKRAFVTTAEANPALSIHEQGGGLIDVPAAIGATVLVDAAPLNLGFFGYPQTDLPVIEKPVTFTNRGEADVSLDLTLAVTHEDGTELPASALSMTPTSLTIPAGGSATTTVRLDATDLPKGVYSGHLTAAGGADLQIPAGFYVEPEMVDLTLTATMRDGRPATRISSVYVADALNPEAGYDQLRFEDGVARGRLAPGAYYIVGRIQSLDGTDAYVQSTTMIGEPTVRLDESATLDFDARNASPVIADTPDHPNASPNGLQQKTMIGYGGPTDDQNFAPQYLGPWKPTFTLGSGPAELNDLEFMQTVRLAEPELAAGVVTPQERDIFIYALPGSPEIDASMDLDLVYVGHGAQADYEGVDAAGKAVLVLRTPGVGDYNAIEATARAHGAEAMLIMNHTTGFPMGAAREAQIPSMTITGEEGERLRAELAEGPVVVNVSGTSWSPYLYDVTLLHHGSMPDGLVQQVRTDDVVTVNNRFHGETGEPMSEYRAVWRPYLVYSAQQYSPVKGGHERAEYVTAGTDSLHRQVVTGQAPSEAGLQERDVYYPEVTQVDHDWFRGVMHPTVLDPVLPRNPGFPIVRDGDTMTVRVPEWSDSSRTLHYGFHDSSTDTSPLKVYVDDQYVGQAARPIVQVTNLPAEESAVRMELTTTRTAPWWQTSIRTLTSWTVRTDHAEESELVPTMVIDYDVDVDLTNTSIHPSRRRGPELMDLHVRHQAGFDGAAISRPKVWISYDDGQTWERRPVHDAGADRFQAVIDSPDAADTPSGFASVKVEVFDADGNSVEQEVIRAWRLATR